VQDNNQNEHSVNEQDFNAHNRVNKNYKQQEAIDEHQNPNPEKLSNLITLNYISVCQFCKENFNSGLNVPYLLKCGHFFCKSCILNNFTNKKNQIVCPDDESKAASLSELKILNNLITGGASSTNNNETANRASVNNYVDESVNIFLI